MQRMADFMRTPNVASLVGYEKGTPGILMIPKVVAQLMTGLAGPSRLYANSFWENSRIPQAELRRSGAFSWIEVDAGAKALESRKLDPWPICAAPEQLVIICAGGEHPTNSCWLQGYCPRVIGREIRLPAEFDRLLAEANRDLGCGSEACLI